MTARAAIPVIAACAVSLALAFSLKATCAGPSQPALYPHVCYTDIQWDRGLFLPGAVPYVNRFVEYPALTGTFMWITAKLAHSQRQYVAISALLMAPFALLTAMWLVGLAGRRALLWSLAPALVLFGFLNWHMLVVSSGVAAVWLWRRRALPAAG